MNFTESRLYPPKLPPYYTLENTSYKVPFDEYSVGGLTYVITIALTSQEINYKWDNDAFILKCDGRNKEQRFDFNIRLFYIQETDEIAIETQRLNGCVFAFYNFYRCFNNALYFAEPLPELHTPIKPRPIPPELHTPLEPLTHAFVDMKLKAYDENEKRRGLRCLIDAYEVEGLNEEIAKSAQFMENLLREYIDSCDSDFSSGKTLINI